MKTLARLAYSVGVGAALGILLMSSASPTVEAQKVKVVWWTEPLQEVEREAIDRLFVKPFNQAHKDVELEVVWKEDLDRVLRTAMQAGAGPDIVQTPGPAYVVEYAQAGHLLPLDRYAARYGWKQKLFPWAYQVGEIDGKLYSLPLTYEFMVLFYNRTLFERNGWKPPANREELEQLATVMQKSGIIPFSHGNASWKGTNEWFVTVFYNHYAGPDAVYEALSGKRRWDDSLFVQAMELLKSYVDSGWFGGGRERYYALDWDTIWGALGNGTAGMKMEGTWGFLHAPSYFQGTGNDWDWAPLPSLRAGVRPTYDIGIGSTVSINAKSAHPDAAAEVLDWLYNNPARAAQIISEVRGEWVVPIAIAPHYFPSQADPRVVRALDAVAKASAAGDYGYTTWTFWPARTEQYIIDGLEEVWNGKITVLEYQRRQQELFQEELKQGRRPPLPTR
ncbi:extracellular solute-binding protein [Carboxydochorda subterranea]|uniref:Extracellular solute-binding protein n=1 Tax=Carboxydichorda subterranea TaxID=3109565 RepID=A0ABZ1BXN9_9FIRM|nr:extracellular solute-binding protein [Limnochorda sp. L945t]WRP17311.1 extracellular solute-binding protein [Limnochorda sp. L945t]